MLRVQGFRFNFCLQLSAQPAGLAFLPACFHFPAGGIKFFPYPCHLVKDIRRDGRINRHQQLGRPDPGEDFEVFSGGEVGAADSCVPDLKLESEQGSDNPGSTASSAGEVNPSVGVRNDLLAIKGNQLVNSR